MIHTSNDPFRIDIVWRVIFRRVRGSWNRLSEREIVAGDGGSGKSQQNWEDNRQGLLMAWLLAWRKRRIMDDF